MIRLAPISFILFITFACSSSIEMVESLNTDFLINCWTHSMEEDPDNETQVYRQCDSMVFPASRFRMFMDLKADGTCEYLELSPVDAHQAVKGTWLFDDAQQQLSILNEKGGTVFESKIRTIAADRIDFIRG